MEGIRPSRKIEQEGKKEESEKREAGGPKDDVVETPSIWRIPGVPKGQDIPETPGIIRIPKEELPTDIDPTLIDSWIRDQERKQEEERERQRQQPEIRRTPPEQMPEYPPARPENPTEKPSRGVEIINIIGDEPQE